ncbi:MAG TPA: ZIP family metal transporter [Methylomirabilota bacterium]|jgi:ZIP family zinc transporter|nr:ZIP family metal transporter [Methylomirabilota bacterium]
MGADRMDGDMIVLLLTGLAMISTFCGGIVAVRGHKRIHLLLGIGAGMLLGATFFDLLPESIDVGQAQGWSARVILLFLVAGFLGFYILERILVLHSCAEDDCFNEAHRRLGRLSVMGLIAHSTLDGAAIGAATLVNWRVGIVVALAVIAHDMSDGLNTILLVTRGEKPRRSDYLFLGMDALAPMVGGFLALGFLPSPKWLAVFLAVASGFFLYTATSDLLPEAHRRSPSPYVTILTIAGVLVMAVAVGLTRLSPDSLRRLIHSLS